MGSHDNASAHPAAEYDAQIETTIPYHAAMHAEVLRLVRTVLPSPREWLDTGCGTGSLVAAALPAFPTTRFLLADPSEGMLARARAKLASAGDRVRLLPPAGTAELALTPGTLDVVTAILCHHYLDHAGRRGALSRCHALLRPGGLLIAFENVRPPSERAIEIARRYWLAYQLEKGKPEELARDHVARFDRDFFPITVLEHLGLLAEVGFETTAVLWQSYLQAGFFAIR